MKFHDELNPKLWDKDDNLKQEVYDKLVEITEAFIEYLNIPEDSILDVRITGSSANYNYTPHSDLDLHVIVDYDKIHKDCPIVEGYLWSVKSQFNKEHDIYIYKIPVELYAEDSRVEAISNGCYSIMNDEWIKRPEKIPPTNNDTAVEAKYNELKEAVDRCDDSEEAQELQDKIYQMRKTGLTEAGELSTENLAFKKLRDAGCLDKLKQLKKQKIDKELTLESYNEDFRNPTGKLAVFLKRNSSNDKDYQAITNYCMSMKDAEAYIKTDIGYDTFGYDYQIRDKKGNILKDVKWTDVYNTDEDYNKTIKHEFKHGHWENIEELLKLANPKASQERINNKIEELKHAYERQNDLRNHMYFDGHTWNESLESYNESDERPLIKPEHLDYGQQYVINDSFRTYKFLGLQDNLAWFKDYQNNKVSFPLNSEFKRPWSYFDTGTSIEPIPNYMLELNKSKANSLRREYIQAHGKQSRYESIDIKQLNQEITRLLEEYK